MLKLVAFLSALALVAARDCDRDCACQDYLLDQCKYPPTPQTAVHVGSLAECKNTCDVFASFNQCDFFYYNAKDDMDENCKIYAGETAQEFSNSCDIVGQPLSNSGGDCYTPIGTDTCSPVCPSCIACVSSKCDQFYEADCPNIGGGQQEESNDIPTQENCVAFCNTLMAGSGVTYSVYHRESTRCECYTSGSRECRSYIVSSKIADPTQCLPSK